MDHRQSPIVTVDVVILTLGEGGLRVLLTERDKPPFENALALPGGYVRTDEDGTAEDAAHRVLLTKARARGVHIEQLMTFSGPDRDPRGYSVSVAYLALIPHSRLPEGALTVPVEEAVGLAFDHDRIVAEGVERLRRKAVYSTAPAALVEQPFTIPDLHAAYEAVLGSRIDAASFRRKMISLSALEESDEKRPGGRGKGRSAQLFTLPEEEVRTFDRTFGEPGT